MKISDEEYNLVSAFTSSTHLDEVMDINYDENEDFFYDFEENKRVSLQEGFKFLAEGTAYSFQFEGFTDEEADVLEKLFQRFVPDFVALDPAND